MSRIIKFRAWDKYGWWASDKKMYYNVQNSYDTIGDVQPEDCSQSFGTLLENDSFIVMQYTGLKDKNGTEIYEGDIIRRHEKYSSGRICKVIFEHGAFWLNCSAIGAFNMEHSTEIMEIIGNIYETPELLNLAT